MRRSWVGVVLAVSLVACSSGSGSNSNSPQARVVSAEAKTRAAGTTKADVTIDYASLPGVSGPVKLKGAGEFDLKAKLGHLHLDLGPLIATASPQQRAGLPPNAGDVDIIFTGTVFFMKAPAFQTLQPDLKPWLKIDLDKIAAAGGASLSQLSQLGGGSDPSQQLALLFAATNVKVVGTEAVRGVATTHYSVTIDLAKKDATAEQRKLLNALKSQVGATTQPVDVWLDGQSRARRFVMKITTKAAQPVTFTTTVEYFDFGSAVSVSEPAPADVTDLGAVSGPSPTTPTTAGKTGTTKKP